MKNIYLLLILFSLLSCNKELSVEYSQCVILGEVQEGCYYIKSTQDIPIADTTLIKEVCATMIKKIESNELMVITDKRCDYPDTETMDIIKEKILLSY